MHENPSFVFFAERRDLAPEDGPVGAMGVPLSAGRSLAVDRDLHGLGRPVWIETEVDGQAFERLMIAQDTGSAIRGPQRGDIFFGTGDRAGKIAGRMLSGGRMVVLVENDRLSALGLE